MGVLKEERDDVEMVQFFLSFVFVLVIFFSCS